MPLNPGVHNTKGAEDEGFNESSSLYGVTDDR